MNLNGKLEQIALESISKLIGIIAVIILTTIFIIIPLQNLVHGFVADHSKTEVVSVIIGGIKDKSELTTASLTTKATVKVAHSKDILKFNVGNARLIYEAVGKIEAAIDINKLEVKEVGKKKSKVHIILPPPQFTKTDIDVSHSGIVDQYQNGVLHPKLDSSLLEDAQKKALGIIVAEACSKDLLETANTNSSKIIGNILKRVGYKQVIIETQAPQKDICQNMKVSA